MTRCPRCAYALVKGRCPICCGRQIHSAELDDRAVPVTVVVGGSAPLPIYWSPRT